MTIPRGLLAGAALAALAVPVVAAAQPSGKVARLGVLATGERLSVYGEAFKAALAEHGWVEGKNLVTEYRFGGERYEVLRSRADELARLKVDAIFAVNAPAARAAKEATTTIPVVFTTPNDPVRAGLVASLARPGGNVTGFAGLGPELDRKRLELLKEVLPRLTVVTILLNPANPMTPQRLPETEQTAATLKIQTQVVTASDARELDQALGTMARARPQGVIVYEDPMFSLHRARLVEWSRKQRVPMLYTLSGWAEEGGLLEYGPNYAAMYRQAAGYVDRILRGARPVDLPVEQPAKLELLINLGTARALGLTIPPALVLRADRVIE